MRNFNPITEKKKNLIVARLLQAASLETATPEIVIQADLIVDADPTPGGTYTLWITNLLVRGGVRLPEDQQKIYQALETYDDLKKKQKLMVEDSNIFKFKRFGDLAEKLQFYRGVVQAEVPKAHEETPLKLVWKNRSFEIYLVESAKTLQKLSRETSWCCSHEDYAKYYIDSGKTFYIVEKRKPARQLRRKQLRRSRDRNTVTGPYLAHFPNLTPLYNQYFSDVERIGQLLTEGIDPMTGQQNEVPLRGEYRPELKKYFNLPVLELVPSHGEKVYERWYTWVRTLISLRHVRAYFETISELPFLAEFQFKDTFDRSVIYGSDAVDRLKPVLRVLEQQYLPQPEDSHLYYRDYYSNITPKRNRKLEKQLLELKDPVKLVDYVQGTAPGRTADTYWERKVPEVGTAKRWKAAEPYIFEDFGEMQRYYELIQLTLSSKEYEYFQKELQKRFEPTKFEWPDEDHLLYRQRIILEGDLIDNDDRLEVTKKRISKAAAAGEESKVLLRGEVTKKDIRVEVEDLKHIERERKLLFEKFQKNVDTLRQFWANLVFNGNKILKGYFDGTDLSTLLYEMFDLFNKPVIIRVLHKIRKEREIPEFLFGEDTSAFAPWNHTRGVYPLFSTKPSIEIVITRLINSATQFGMIYDEGVYLTPISFLTNLGQRWRIRRGVRRRQDWRTKAQARRKRTLKRRHKIFMEFVNSINRKFDKMNP